MKQWGMATAALLMVGTSALANEQPVDNFATTGAYVIGQVGVAGINPGFFDDFIGPVDIPSNTGFAARIGTGYQINRYFAIESGITAYPSATRTYDGDSSALGINGVKADSKLQDIYTWDVMARLQLPMGDRFFLGGGVGASLIHISYTAMNARSGNVPVLTWSAGSAMYVAPKVDLRAGVKINPQVSVFVDASHVFAVNNSGIMERNYQPDLDMASVGVSYQF